MLALSIHSPFGPPSLPPTESPDLEGAIQRALEEAGTVSGAFASSPCRFRPLGPEVCGRLRALRPLGAEMCVLVTVRGSAEAGHRAHLRERCLTAAQRLVLALSCEGVRNTWTDEVPDEAAFDGLGVDLNGQVPVGLIWCAPES